MQKNKNKCWVWIAFDIVSCFVLAYHIGDGDKKTTQKFWAKIPAELKSCNFETDDWEAYQSIIPSAQHKVGKDLTFYIEEFNATIRARVSPFG